MARRFVSIWFPYLATDWHSRKQPHLREKAFVLKTSLHNRLIVAAANSVANAQGIHKGMVLADAKALCPSVQVLDDKPGLTTQLLTRIAEWCIRFTPVAAPDVPSGVILDATGCTHLWGGEEAYLNDISRRLTDRGYTVRLAIADTIGCSWATARYCREKMIIEKRRQLEALEPLPVAALRLSSDVIVLLNKLGLRQIRDIIPLPATSLRRRFGQELLQRLRQAIGEEEEFLTPVYPLEPYQERLPCIEPILTLTGIELALQNLLDTLCLRLQNEGKGLRKAFFRAYRMEGGTTGIEIGTHRATSNKEHLFQLFTLKLSTMEPKEGIELFLLEATNVEDCNTVQESLWQTNGSLQDPQLAELMDRLTGALGPECIHRYLPAEHHWPERSFRQAASLEDKGSTEWNLARPRPLHLLSPPEHIEVTAPVPDYPPMNFRYKNQLHKIIKADGPERIEQEWWIQEGEHRDYYCVEDEEGRRYWLFRSGHYTASRTEQWFLHGFFA